MSELDYAREARDGRRLPPHQRRGPRRVHPPRAPLAHHAARAHARARRGAELRRVLRDRRARRRRTGPAPPSGASRSAPCSATGCSTPTRTRATTASSPTGAWPSSTSAASRSCPPSWSRGMKRYMSAAIDGDWAEFDRACVEVLGYDPDDESWDLYRSYTMELMVPLCSDTPLAVLPREGARARAVPHPRPPRARQGPGRPPQHALRPQDAAGLHVREPPPVGPRLGARGPAHRGRVPPAHRALGQGRARAHPRRSSEDRRERSPTAMGRG